MKSQSQNLITILKVSVSVLKIETGYTESQPQSQHAKTCLANPATKVDLNVFIFLLFLQHQNLI